MAVAAVAPEVKKQERAPDPVVLRRADVELEEFRNNRWRCYAPAGMTIDDLSKTHTWGTMREQFKPYDVVLVLPKDETWLAEVLIIDSSQAGGVDAIVMRQIKLPPKRRALGARIPPGHLIERDAQTGKYYVLRQRDNVTMQSGFDEHEQALRWLLDHASIRQG